MAADPVTHYSTLGVRPDATADEIRAAYRRLARVNHPDAAGESAAGVMARLNEAWRVLSDPGRRAVYDASLRPVTATPGRATYDDHPYRASAPRPAGDRFPIKPIVALTLFAAVVMFIFSATTKPGGPPAADWRIDPGSCVTILPNLDAKEISCDGPHDGVAKQVVSFDTACPIDTVTHRDIQGMGNICVATVGA